MFPSPSSSPFQFSNFGTPQQQQQQQQQQVAGFIAGNASQIHLISTDGTPLSYQAKWSDIHDESKKTLLAVEERILVYRDESRRLDQCQRLYDSAALHKGFELEARRISQELGSVGANIETEQLSLGDMVEAAKVLMRNAEVAVRSFMMLRHHFARLKAPPVAAVPTTTAGPLALGFPNNPSTVSSSAPPPAPVADFYIGIPSKPSPFLQQAAARFETQLADYTQRVQELERLLNDSYSQGENGRANSQLSLLESLPTVMTNVHDFFIHVAAKVESLHQQVENMRIAFIADRRRRGDDANPFIEADRREVAKREVAEKRVHPTLHGQLTPLLTHMPGGNPNSQALGYVQSTPFSVPSSTSGAQGFPSLFSSSAPVQFTNSTVSTTPFGSSTPLSTFPVFGASTPNTNIFGANNSTPAGTSLFGAQTTPTSGGLFGASPASPFGTFGQQSASTPKQMARAPTAATPLFSMAATPTAATPLYGAVATPNPAAPLFGTPAPGTAGVPVKPRPRGPRRK